VYDYKFSLTKYDTNTKSVGLDVYATE